MGQILAWVVWVAWVEILAWVASVEILAWVAWFSVGKKSSMGKCLAI